MKKKWKKKKRVEAHEKLHRLYKDRKGDNLVEDEVKEGLFPVLTEKEGFLRIRDFDGREYSVKRKDVVLLIDAPAHYTDLIRANEKDSWAWNMRGVAWMQRRELDTAIKDFTEAIRLDPEYSVAFNNRGSAWKAKNEYDRAIWDFDEAIRLDPKFATAFYNRGITWTAKKNRDKAIEDYDEAIRLDPKYAQAFLNRGSAWGHKKEYDRAIQDFDEAIRLDPKYSLAFCNRGLAWCYKHEYERAIGDFDETIRLDPKKARAHFNRSLAQMLTGRAEAFQGFQAMLDIQGWKGNRTPYAVILGHFAARQCKEESAAKRFLADSPGKLAEDWPYPAVRFLRGDIDEPALLKLATDEDKRTEARCYIGLDHMLKGRNAKALAHFRWVKKHGNPSFVECGIALAELDRLEQRGEKEKK